MSQTTEGWATRSSQPGMDSVGRLGRGDNGTVRVPSSDHVNLAVHEFGGDGPPLLLSHATGFHGYAYLPIADALERRFTSYAVEATWPCR